MKSKHFDSLGRIHIPKEYRDILCFSTETDLQIEAKTETGELIIKKREDGCILCKSSLKLTKIKDGIYLCEDCLRSLKNLSLGI
ncbi:MAG: hypothetical protein IKU24_00280 [Clostridia bacterium]|nr:hypothetical protein [Clostridia bacterium]